MAPYIARLGLCADAITMSKPIIRHNDIFFGIYRWKKHCWKT